jgi:hypothetical protein
MAILPNETSIQRAQPRSSDTVVSGQPDPIAGAASAFGAGVAQLGRGVGAVGQVIEQQQSDAERYNTENELIKLEKEHRRFLDDQKSKADGDGAGFADSARKAFDDRANSIFNAASPRLQPIVKNRLQSLDGTFNNEASNFEAARRDAHYGRQLSDNLDGMRSDVATDPSKHAEIKARGLELIRIAPISAAAKERLIETWKSGAALSAVQSDIQRDPDAVSIRLPTGPIGSKIARGMETLAPVWGKNAAAAIIGHGTVESELNTGARNKGDGRDGSDSIGIMQWNSDRATALKAFAKARGSDWQDYDTQIAFIDRELRTTEKATGDRLKAAKTPEEAARIMTDYLRPAGWKSDDPSGAMHFDKRMGRSLKIAKEYGTATSYADDLSEDQRRQIGSASERAYANKQQQEAVATRAQNQQLRRTIADDLASAERTGQGLPDDKINRAIVAKQAGEEAAVQWEQGRARALRVHDAMKGIETLPEQDMDERLKRLEPVAGSQGFEADQEAFNAAERRVERIRKARAADPALSVEALDAVKEARKQAQYEDIGGKRSIVPQSAQAIIKARLDSQNELGVQSPLAVTRTEAREIARSLRSIGEDNEDGVEKFMRGLRRTYGKYAEDVLSSTLQLQGVNKNLSNVATEILSKVAAGIPPSPAEMRRLENITMDAAMEQAMQGKSVPRAPVSGTQPDSMTGFMPPVGDPDQPNTPRPLTPGKEVSGTLIQTRPDGTRINYVKELVEGRISDFDFDILFNAGDGESASLKARRQVEARTGKSLTPVGPPAPKAEAPPKEEPKPKRRALKVERDENGRTKRFVEEEIE